MAGSDFSVLALSLETSDWGVLCTNGWRNENMDSGHIQNQHLNDTIVHNMYIYICKNYPLYIVHVYAISKRHDTVDIQRV